MRKKLQPLLLPISGLFLLPLLIIVSYQLAYWHRIYPGVTILGQPLGNYTLSEAKKIINAKTKAKSKVLILETKQQKWLIPLDELQFSYRVSATAQKAYHLGRSDSLKQNLISQFHLWFSPQDLDLEYSINQPLLKTKIATISSQIFIPAIEPTIKIEKHLPHSSTPKITILPGQAGQELDQRQLLSLIDRRLAQNRLAPIKIPIIQLSPKLTESKVKKIQNRAEKFLSKKLILINPHQPNIKQTETEQWQLQEKELIDFLAFDSNFNRVKISQWVANLAQSINHPAENATFRFLPSSPTKVTQFRPAKEGQILNQEKTISLIIHSLQQLQAGKKQITALLPITTTPPQITTADANNLGIRQLIGQGISFFRGSDPSRLHNIKLAAAKLNGLLVAPNTVFSFNQSLGEISKATGFKPAYIIQKGKTILGDGGGVCQVSTTLFRAVLDTGLPIVERRAHAYRVSYYEQNYQPGFDATVFAPHPDLKFKNNTPAYILIQTLFNQKKNQLIFKLYGTSDGRTVTISKAKIWDQTAPPPDRYIDDPSLPAGQIKQIEHKIWGAKVSFNYKVTRNGETLEEKTFYSFYQPWQAVFLRGIKN